MKHKTINTEQGHWLLAKMGKRVLRPGGLELTQKLISAVHISPRDAVVEFAPGIGFTASLLLAKQPQSYTGIELNGEAATLLKAKFDPKKCEIINTSAAQTGLPDSAADKVVGEAMLTMQADHRKSEIIKEAHRILKKGGFYAIHELGLTPDTLNAITKSNIQRELAQVIQVNARPLTQLEWCALLENEGFKIVEIHTAPMLLLETKRMVQDEGLFRTLKIGFNILTHPKAKRKIGAMRKIFQKHKRQMAAFAIIAQK